MQGFGILKELDKWSKLTAFTEAKELIPMKDLTDKEDREMENVDVPTLDTDEYRRSDYITSKSKASGSAGNLPNRSLNNEKDPQLGSIDCEIDPQMDGLGGGISGSFNKAMSRTEAFDNNNATDESPMDEARERTTSSVIERIEDIFGEMFGKSYQEKAKEKNYDLDATIPMVITKSPTQFKVKKGW